MREISKNRPSNIETGWRQKHFYHLGQDSVLDGIIKVFQAGGNGWVMEEKDFVKLASLNKLYDNYLFPSVSAEVLEKKDGLIRMTRHIVESLLTNSWQRSFRNIGKRFRRPTDAKWPYDG